MPQNLSPRPSAVPHPNLSAPTGTVLLEASSLVLPDGGGPFVALPVEGGGVRVKRLPPEVAAELLSWSPGEVQPRLATDEELAELGLAVPAPVVEPAAPSEALSEAPAPVVVDQAAPSAEVL